MSDLAYRSACELAAMIHSKQISSAELTEYFIERIERLDGEVNSVVVRDFERGIAGSVWCAVCHRCGGWSSSSFPVLRECTVRR